MNYDKIYNLLVSRAKSRINYDYTENHHIIPACMGGSDDKNNMVRLTAREHFVAHQLLVKMYPKQYGLIKAVQYMCIGQEERKIVNNRMYAWLKERFSKEQSRSQTGEGNSQFGSMWIHNLDLRESKKINKEDFPTWGQEGWLKGRKINFSDYDTENRICGFCKTTYVVEKRIRKSFCSDNCKKEHKSHLARTAIWSEESRTKVSNNKKGTGIGENNSQFNKIWICNHTLEENKRINKKDADTYLLNGWEIGRKMLYYKRPF